VLWALYARRAGEAWLQDQADARRGDTQAAMRRDAMHRELWPDD
jgi:hypothetical protein